MYRAVPSRPAVPSATYTLQYHTVPYPHTANSPTVRMAGRSFLTASGRRKASLPHSPRRSRARAASSCNLSRAETHSIMVKPQDPTYCASPHRTPHHPTVTYTAPTPHYPHSPTVPQPPRKHHSRMGSAQTATRCAPCAGARAATACCARPQRIARCGCDREATVLEGTRGYSLR
jgi:hypothetical protein